MTKRKARGGDSLPLSRPPFYQAKKVAPIALSQDKISHNERGKKRVAFLSSPLRYFALTAVSPAELNGASHLNGHASAAAISSNHAAHVTVHEAVPIIPRPPRLGEAASRMKTLGKEGKWREVMSVLRELQRDAETDSALRPDLTVFNAAVGAVAKSGRWEEVSALLNTSLCLREGLHLCRVVLPKRGRVSSTHRRTSSKDP